LKRFKRQLYLVLDTVIAGLVNQKFLNFFLILILNNRILGKTLNQIIQFVMNNRIHLNSDKYDMDIIYFESTDTHMDINEKNIDFYNGVLKNYLKIKQSWDSVEQFKSLNNNFDHYRLLASLVETLDAKKVIEFGTGSGISAFAVLTNPNVKILTFDAVHYKKFNWARYKHEQEFIWNKLEQNKNFTQIIKKIDKNYIESEKVLEEILDSSLIIIDLDHSGKIEKDLLKIIYQFQIRVPIYIDDSKISTLKNLTQEFNFEELDFSSIGHFSGSKLLKLK